MRTLYVIPLSALLGASLSCTGVGESQEGSAVRGAIFTSTKDGAAVDENIYSAKEDVYLDGGPGANAPSAAAGLDAGDYFFQVTDPSGQTLLSSDDILCRRFHVDDTGVIDKVVEGPNGCQHNTGVDQDHAGVTVQLFPYDDTPNPGGEYKVWVIAVGNYNASYDRTHGFVPRYSKTDNFKVRVTSQPACGDGHVDSGEQCDDGNTANGDGCSSTCTTEEHGSCCGDGNVDAGEQCDDGNTTNGDGCSSTCTSEAPVCGNGRVETGEACDDGNTTAGDGCSATCTAEPVCGNGTVESGEACDDGNTTAGDGCSATCTVEPCCGDGHVDAGEQCDDGNTVNGDGCSSSCTTEAPVCGNGVLETGEQCDDGNTTGGDGCSATCSDETTCGGVC